MKIAATTLDFSSQHSAASSHTLQESLRAWVGAARPDAGNSEGRPRTQASISEQARSARAQEKMLQTASAMAADDTITGADSDPVLLLIKSMVEMLTGRVIRVFSGAELQAPQPVELTDPKQAAQAVQSLRNAGFGIDYQRHEVRSESEQTAFQAEGTVRTADGREIKFQLDIVMQRSFHEESHFSLRAGAGTERRKDPLVINFSGTAAQLQGQRFRFDIEGRGHADSVPLLAAGSGFLALDLNGNGKIDSGRELFGAASGNGFADLAKYDSDGNGWIDESDPVFGKLRAWMPNAQGGGTLASLREKQVGALFLGKQATPFELRDGANRALGAVRSSGLYLAENGSAGTLQQIDLNV